MEYPEHEKLSKVADQSQVIGEFLDWANEKHRLFLATYPEGREYAARVHTPIRDLLAEFFEIDQDKLEQEKRAMLDRTRALNEKSEVAGG